MKQAITQELSPAQREALLASHPQLLVSAAAGSGKTRLLVAHLVRALVELAVAPEKVVAVTFTRAAATEIAARTRQELIKLGRPDLARELDAATIGTIHSLCLKLIRDHALVLGIDPRWSVAEEQGAAILKQRALELAWDQLVTEADQETLELIARETHVLEREALYLYDRLRTLGDDNPQIHIPYHVSLDETRATLVSAIERALTLKDTAKEGSYLAKDLATLKECLVWLSQPSSCDDLRDALLTSGQFYPSRRTRSAEHVLAPVREALFRYRCALVEEHLRPLAAVMNLLLKYLHEHYQALKRMRGVLDFNDLELYAKKLVELSEQGLLSGPLLPGGVVLVDEFQDTNELQCRILEGLGASRVVLVGDERQSIYRFRGADVTVFRQRRKAFAESGSGSGAQTVVTLDENYRSTSQILAFVNKVFSSPGFFGKEPAGKSGFEPAEGSGFVPLRKSGKGSAGRSVEILLAERLAVGQEESEPGEESAQDFSIQEAEAQVIADRVYKLVTQEGWRNADIAVLLPAYTQVEVYQQALFARGLPVYLTRGRRFYSRQEIMDIACFLRLLVNCHDDLALAAVLRSPLVGLSDDGLFLLGEKRKAKRRDKPASLWSVVAGQVSTRKLSGLSEEDLERLTLFMDRYRELRSMAGRVSLAYLIERILTKFDYDLYLLTGDDGKRRFANVRKLMRIADEYESLEGPDLVGFAAVLKARAETEDKESEAPTLGKGENVIQVTTIHQAKGLEFPCVVVGGLGSAERRDRGRWFAVGDDGRMAAFARNTRSDRNEPCDPCWGPGQEIEADNRQKEAEEDIRRLYVAMTRAKEHLVLVGAVRTGHKSVRRIHRILEALGIGELESLKTPLIMEDPPVRIELVRPCVRPAEGVHEEAQTVSKDQPEPPRLLEPVPVILHPREISFSALALYRECPRRFYFERVLGLAGGHALAAFAGLQQEDYGQVPEAVSDALEREAGLATGLLVHALLERFGHSATQPGEQLLREAAQQWISEFGDQGADAALDRVVALASAFWESPVRKWVANLPCLREVPFNFAYEGILVSGVIDLLARGSDRWYVVDYKTNRLEGRSLPDLVDHYRLQGQIYSLAALKAGAPEVSMNFVFLERARDPVVLIYKQSQMDELGEAVSHALSGIKEGKYLPSCGPHCSACPFASLCK